MTKIITWKCSECENEDKYPAGDGVTLEKLQHENTKTNTMCKLCGAPCFPISIEDAD